MYDSIVFDDDAAHVLALPTPVPEGPTMAASVVRFGIAGSFKDAAVLLAIGAFLLIAASIYFLASSIPENPVLDADTLRQGETVPDYVRIR